MNGRQRGITRAYHSATARLALAFAGSLLLSLALMHPSHAESTVQAGTAAGAAVSASAHLNFRVTVLPSLTMSMLGSAVHVQGNAGALVLQHEQRNDWDGRAPASSWQLRQHHQVIDTVLSNTSSVGSTLVTLAAP